MAKKAPGLPTPSIGNVKNDLKQGWQGVQQAGNQAWQGVQQAGARADDNVRQGLQNVQAAGRNIGQSWQQPAGGAPQFGAMPQGGVNFAQNAMQAGAGGGGKGGPQPPNYAALTAASNQMARPQIGQMGMGIGNQGQSLSQMQTQLGGAPGGGKKTRGAPPQFGGAAGPGAAPPQSQIGLPAQTGAAAALAATMRK